MEAALGWLGDIFQAILRLIPHIILVRATHAGVKFKCGRDIVLLTHDNGIYWVRIGLYLKCLPYPYLRRTGVHFYWPLVTEYEVVPIKRQTTNLQAQYLCCADKKNIGVSGIVVYEIHDVIKLLTECYDYDDTIKDLALVAVKAVIIKYDMDYIKNNNRDVDAELTKTLREQLRRFGVKTIRVTLSDFCECRVFGLWGGWE